MMGTSYGRQILLVEDDPRICQDVRQYLERDGFSVIVCERGQQAIEKIARALPDLALIDLDLPDMNGFDVCRALKRYADIPIIVLTRFADEDYKVTALDQFAEDYITKPCGLREIEARIGCVLRRCSGPAEEAHPEYVVDDHLRINFSQHWIEVKRQDEKGVEYFHRALLTPIESRLMHILLRNAGRIMTTDALLTRVWASGADAFPEGLRVHIRRLRVKIEPIPAAPRYIVTERGLGYRFAVPIRSQVLAHGAD
jgi:DNA-binding response OmpR family regulator